MKKFKNILFAVAIILLTISSTYSNLYAKKEKTGERISYLTDEDIKRIDETTWRVNIITDIKNSYFNAIQFTIFESDPIPLLKDQWKIAREVNKGRDLTEFDKTINISTSWDLIFLTKNGAEVYLLKSVSKVKDSVIVSANTQSGKKWLVSKSVQNKDGGVSAWIIPFDAEIGKSINIELNENNKFNFGDVFEL